MVYQDPFDLDFAKLLIVIYEDVKMSSMFAS